MDKDVLSIVLKSHRKWLSDPRFGKKANLRGANLFEADLPETNLRGGDLRGANLRGADLCGAVLFRADLRGADLFEANLRGADLRGTDLRGADLREANLHGADLRGANLYEATGCIDLGQQNNDMWRAVAYFRNEEWRILAGCRDFTIEEAKKHWDLELHASPRRAKEMQCRIAMLEAMIAQGILE